MLWYWPFVCAPAVCLDPTFLPFLRKKIRVGYTKYQTLSMVLTRTSKLHYVHILVV